MTRVIEHLDSRDTKEYARLEALRKARPDPAPIARRPAAAQCVDCFVWISREDLTAEAVAWAPGREVLICPPCALRRQETGDTHRQMAADADDEAKDRRRHRQKCDHCSRWAGMVPPGVLAVECRAKARQRGQS